MALADMRRHAEHFLRVAQDIPQCTGCGVVAVGDDVATLFLNLAVEMPTHWQAQGSAPNGVLPTERVEVVLGQDYPWRCPSFSLRKDFPRDLAHLTPGSATLNPSPCLVDGSLDEFFHQHGLLELSIGAIVNQMGIWLGRAAIGTLMNAEQGWEPVMRQGLPDRLVIDADFARGQVTNRSGCVWLATKYMRSDVIDGRPSYLLAAHNEFAAAVGDMTPFPFDPEGDARYSGITVTALMWPASGAVTKQVLGETIETLDDLAKRAGEIGCGREFTIFLDRLERRWQRKRSGTVFPVAVVLCVRRPFALMGRDSAVEMLPYLFEITAPEQRTSLFGGPRGKGVVPVEQLDRTTPKLLRTLSAAPQYRPFSLDVYKRQVLI